MMGGRVIKSRRLSLTDQDYFVLSFGHQTCVSPSISFDDNRVAFACEVNNNWDIYVYDPVYGRMPYRATTSSARDMSPSWTPEGNLLFVSDRQGPLRLYEAEVEMRTRNHANSYL